jgi:hypothetical protein
MENGNFGKQQFVGKVNGAVTDNYQMLKVNFFVIFRKLDQEVMAEYTKLKIKLPVRLEHVNNSQKAEFQIWINSHLKSIL